VVTKNTVDPSIDRSLWRLEVTGKVMRSITYRFEDLTALPAVGQETTLMCISNQIGSGLMSNAIWKGVPLRSLIEAAGPTGDIVKVVLHAADGYTDTVAYDKALDPTTLVVYEMNGEPLPERHGFPARVLAPGLFGEKNVKWVTRIELVGRNAIGFYERQGWGPSFTIPTRSRIDFPGSNQSLALGMPVVVRGVAFAGNRGVSRVEVSLDDGQNWQAAQITYPGTKLTWVLWRYDWLPSRAGSYRLIVRATDSAGELQTSRVRGTISEGAT
jgi:DMSO/TMAO reductase YedYZ molybdopterin-dependent catalytic subunit